MAKEEKKMETTKTSAIGHETPKSEAKSEAKVFEIQELKQKQNVLNLDTMDDSEITVVTKKIVFLVSDPKIQLAEMQKLVQPAEAQVSALAKYLEQESYKQSKEAALASGNFMSSQLRSALTQIMGGISAFADNKAGENFKYWQEAYKDKADPSRAAKAKKLLDRARLLVDTEEFGTM